MSSVDVSGLGAGLDDLDGRSLAERLGEIEQAIRALEATAVAVIATADRRGVYGEDGHVSVRGWTKAAVRLSDTEVTHRVRTARLVTTLPACGEALMAGRLGVAQVRELARLHANPRCGDQLAPFVGMLVGFATRLPYETFCRTTRHWERLADADGAHRDHDQTHEARHAALSDVEGTFYLTARVGAAHGAQLADVFDAFVDAEFHADWADARARLGDDASPDVLARSESQRRADAIVAIFNAAAKHSTANNTATDTPAPAPVRVPVVDIIIDQPIFDEQLRALLTNTPARFDVDPHHARCRTTNGQPIDPADAVVAALIGHVRRVVVGTDGVITNLGRRSRLFTGNARTAALLQSGLDDARRCLWPGCINRRCQLDHTQAWTADHGNTDTANSGPLCPRHNRWKTRGYHTWRDPDGTWHTQRPDGTEITTT